MRSAAEPVAGASGRAELRIGRVVWLDDGSAASPRALAAALELSRPHHARLSRIGVAGPAGAGADLDAILARSAGADLIVMGDAGPSAAGLAGLAGAVLRQARCPVLLVRGGLRRPPRILCPIEFSDASRASLAWAAALARAAGVGLVLVHVFEWFPDEPRDQDALLVPEFHTDLAASARDAMRRLGREAGVEAELVVATGAPHRQILRVARGRGIDLIVLGAHGRRGVDRQLPGGTTSHVLRQADCSVLSVRPC